MRDFESHSNYSFLNYAKSSTDLLTAKGYEMYPNRMSKVLNIEALDLFKHINSINFYSSIVAFKINKHLAHTPSTRWNHKNAQIPADFRHEGSKSATINWPDPYRVQHIEILGQKSNI
jgi:hypothetical protein